MPPGIGWYHQCRCQSFLQQPDRNVGTIFQENMCQQASVMVPLFPASLKQQGAVVFIQQVLQQGRCLAGKRLFHLVTMPGFRGIDTDKTQPAPVLQFYRVTIIDMNNLYTFTDALGRTAFRMGGLGDRA